MKKFYVKLGFSKLKSAHKIVKTKSIVANMTGNINFVTPTPGLAIVDAAADDLGKALTNMDGKPENTAIKNQAEATLDLLINSLGGYVQSACQGDEVKILSSGFDVHKQRTPATLLGPVTNLTAKLGLNPGEVVIKWKGIKGGKLNVISGSNIVNATADDLKPMAESTKSKIAIANLQSGVVYYFRIAVINSAGMGPWSETISIKVY